MAHKKAGGSTSNGRNSPGQRLGVKRFGGQTVKPGDIIVRQRGSKMIAGNNVIVGNDFTLHAAAAGTVQFRTVRRKAFSGLGTRSTEVSVVASS